MSNNPFKNNPANKPNTIDKSLQPQRRTIEVGKFYLIHDGSKTGHPGFVISKNDELNRYLVIRTESDKKGAIPKKERGDKHLIKLKHTIGGNIVSSYIKSRPTLCKRKDIGILLDDLVFDYRDLFIIQTVANREPDLAPSLKK